MNTIPTTASANHSILAIDLGKYKSIAYVLDRGSFHHVQDSRAELRGWEIDEPSGSAIQRTPPHSTSVVSDGRLNRERRRSKKPTGSLAKTAL